MLKYAFLAIAAAFAVGVSLRVSQILWSPLAIALRFMCLMAMLGMAVLAFVFFQVASDEGYVAGYILAGLLALLCLSLLGRLSQTGSASKKDTGGYPNDFHDNDVPQTDQWPGARLLRWGERRRIRRARNSIDAFLAEAGSPSLSNDHKQLELTLRKRVPEHLAELQSRCERASPSECRRYGRDFLESIEKLARRAEQARTEIRSLDDHKLNVFHEYFSQVADRPAGPSR